MRLGQAENSESLTLSVNEFGKEITVKAVGGNNYDGATATSAPTGKVNAVGVMTLRGANQSWPRGWNVNKNTERPQVGTTYTPTVNARHYEAGVLTTTNGTNITDLAEFTWTVGGYVSTERTYTIDNADLGSTVKCEVTGIVPAEDGALTWDNGLEVTSL